MAIVSCLVLSISSSELHPFSKEEKIGSHVYTVPFQFVR